MHKGVVCAAVCTDGFGCLTLCFRSVWHLCVVETMVEQLSPFPDWRRLGVCTVHDSNDIGSGAGRSRSRLPSGSIGWLAAGQPSPTLPPGSAPNDRTAVPCVGMGDSCSWECSSRMSLCVQAQGMASPPQGDPDPGTPAPKWPVPRDPSAKLAWPPDPGPRPGPRTTRRL